jgi:DNA-directed RNA polymerase specialized sigma subunit
VNDYSIPGFGTEPQEVKAVLDALVGERDGEDLSAWFIHLSSRQALFDEAVKKIAEQREQLAYELYRQLGTEGTYATVADILNLSRSRAQQLIERARALA